MDWGRDMRGCDACCARAAPCPPRHRAGSPPDKAGVRPARQGAAWASGQVSPRPACLARPAACTRLLYRREPAAPAPAAAQQLQFEINFHYARALAWAAVGVRAVNIALGSREPWHWVAATITILGAITTVLPSFAHRLPPAMYLR